MSILEDKEARWKGNTKFSLKGHEEEVKKIDKSLHWGSDQFIDDSILENLGKEQCQNRTK